MIRAAEALAAALAVLPGPVLGHCAQLVHEDTPYTICEAAAEADLRLFLTDAEGATFGSFERIESELAAAGLGLGFAMNAGMYHPDRRPVGLYVEAGETRARLVTSEGPGNFGMLPNGVFCIREAGYAVVESRAFAAEPPDCRDATQSGPMLVIDGDLHPRFLAGSDSRLIRNGVGVSADGQMAYFAISNRPVNFHEFARLFRDALEVPQALYFDGNVSRLHAPDLGRSDWGRPMGPVVGLVTPLAAEPGADG
jgi:uncharacterized protein YigE (DUF2233 family)